MSNFTFNPLLVGGEIASTAAVNFHSINYWPFSECFKKHTNLINSAEMKCLLGRGKAEIAAAVAATSTVATTFAVCGFV